MTSLRPLAVFALIAFISTACGDTEDPPAETPLDAGEVADATPEEGPEPDPPTPDGSPDPEPEVVVFSDDPLEWPLGEDGPFWIGFRSWEVTWSSPEDDSPRTILMNVWYPTLAEEGEPAVHLGLGAFRDEEVFTGAPLAGAVYARGYPVHAHSHGFQGFGGTSSDLMRHFASHGWVGVAPDHTHNTLTDHTDPLPTAHYFQRPLDITAVLDALEGLPEDDPLAGKVDTSRVVLSGHSFGAFTTWVSLGAAFDLDHIQARCETGDFPEGTCTEAELAAFSLTLSDPRVVATIPMAGTLRANFFGDTGHRSVHGPVFFMSGSDDDVGAQDQFEGIDEIDFTWIDLEGGCHQTFALGFCNTLDTEEGFAIVNTYALAFSRREILGDTQASTAAILDGASTVSEKVTLRRKP